jgi:hypothetical protein
MDVFTEFASVLPKEVKTKVAEFTSSLPITRSIPTTIAQNYKTITSILHSVSERQASAVSALFIVTDSESSISLLDDILQAQATLNFYDVLEQAATETNLATRASLMTQAAEASEIMLKMFDENAYYSGNYPSLGGNTALLVVFSLFLSLQVASGVFYHQWWFLTCWSCGLLFEILGYAARMWSSQNIMSYSAFIMQLVCLTLAPCFLMAGIYYIIAQLAVIYGSQFSILGPMQYSLLFIVCDFISILLQAAGGGLSTGNGTTGPHIMIGGLAFQVFTIALFQYFWYFFLFRIYESYKTHGEAEFNPEFAHIRKRNLLLPFMCVVSFAVALIFVRSIYRLIELSVGWSSKLAVDEIYFMILEALMVSLASCAMSILSPGLAYGKDSHIYIDKSLKTTLKSFGKKEEKNLGPKSPLNDGSVNDFSSDDESQGESSRHLFREEV